LIPLPSDQLEKIYATELYGINQNKLSSLKIAKPSLTFQISKIFDCLGKPKYGRLPSYPLVLKLTVHQIMLEG
jgi:hypothetical protein